jgi:hypothetical protein
MAFNDCAIVVGCITNVTKVPSRGIEKAALILVRLSGSNAVDISLLLHPIIEAHCVASIRVCFFGYHCIVPLTVLHPLRSHGVTGFPSRRAGHENTTPSPFGWLAG